VLPASPLLLLPLLSTVYHHHHHSNSRVDPLCMLVLGRRHIHHDHHPPREWRTATTMTREKQRAFQCLPGHAVAATWCSASGLHRAGRANARQLHAHTHIGRSHLRLTHLLFCHFRCELHPKFSSEHSRKSQPSLSAVIMVKLSPPVAPAGTASAGNWFC